MDTRGRFRTDAGQAMCLSAGVSLEAVGLSRLAQQIRIAPCFP